MALVWQSTCQGNHYKITRAGKSLRLYRNGVFHTQYHPERIVTGDIWELMLLAGLNLPKNAKVLVLGAGGGAVANLLNHFEQPGQIDLLDLDKTILEVCEQYFLTRSDNVNFLHSDAGEWVQSQLQRKYPPQYDLIIEDVFGEREGEPVKVFDFNKQWLEQLCALLKTDGRLVMNFETSRQFKQSPVVKRTGILKDKGFVSGLRFCSPRYQNNIGLFSRTEVKAENIREEVIARPLLKKYRHSYYIRGVF